MVIRKIRDSLSKIFTKKDEGEEYIEVDLGEPESKRAKVQVKLIVLKEYEDVVEVLNALREGYTIAVIDIKTLKSKDMIELKRAISKIKKTVDALEGSITGFGENIVIATPSFAEISKPAMKKEKKRIEEL